MTGKALPLPQRFTLIGLEGFQEEIDDTFLPGLNFCADRHAGVNLQIPVIHVELFFIQGYHDTVELTAFLVFNSIGADFPHLAFKSAEFLPSERYRPKGV